MTKRLFDIVVSAMLLCTLSPVVAFLALLVRLKLGSPVLFRQRRPGPHGKPFTLYKFRTMTDERDEHGNLLPDEQRLTPFGKWLRATSLDEHPELWNVLKGDVSRVGPRPLLMEHLERYTPEQARRDEVTPSITRWAQVSSRNALTRGQTSKLGHVTCGSCALVVSPEDLDSHCEVLASPAMQLWNTTRVQRTRRNEERSLYILMRIVYAGDCDIAVWVPNPCWNKVSNL